MMPLPNSQGLHASSTLPGVTNHENIIPISIEDTKTVITRLSEMVLILGSSEEIKSFDTEKGALFFFLLLRKSSLCQQNGALRLGRKYFNPLTDIFSLILNILFSGMGHKTHLLCQVMYQETCCAAKSQQATCSPMGTPPVLQPEQALHADRSSQAGYSAGDLSTAPPATSPCCASCSPSCSCLLYAEMCSTGTTSQCSFTQWYQQPCPPFWGMNCNNRIVASTWIVFWVTNPNLSCLPQTLWIVPI